MSLVSHRPQFYRSLAVIALVAATTVFLNGTRVILPDHPLSIYLGDTSYRGTSTWQTGLFGGKTQWNSMDRFIQLRGEHDRQENYGLLDQNSEAMYHQQFSRLAESALNDFVSFHTDALKESAKKGTIRALSLDQLRFDHTTMVFAGVAAAVYTGRTLRYSLNSDLSLESQTLIRSERKQYLGWVSADLGASIGGTYDAAAGQMNYSVRKNLTSNVTMDYERTADHSVGFSYSTGF